jgi:hypothetical protein
MGGFSLSGNQVQLSASVAHDAELHWHAPNYPTCSIGWRYQAFALTEKLADPVSKREGDISTTTRLAEHCA